MDTVKRLIQQSENHPNRDSLIKDLNKTEESNRRSWAPAWTTLNTSSFARPLPRYNALSALYIGKRPLSTAHAANASCLRKGIDRCTKKDSTFCQFLATSSKKNPTHGARHGPSVRQTMYGKAHDMLRKARSNKNGSCKTSLERWDKDDQYRKSLSDIVWAEEQIRQYDAIALEDHP